MSKVSELRLHARNRKLPTAACIGRLEPQFISYNLFIYDSLKGDSSNYTGMKTAEERHEHAVAGVSTGNDVYKLGDFYNQIHTSKIQVNDNDLKIKFYNTRYAILNPGHDLEYHMDPPNIYNIIIPLSDPITFKAQVSHMKGDSIDSVDIEIGEMYFVNPSYMHMTSHESDEPRVAILANFDYDEEIYDTIRGLL